MKAYFTQLFEYDIWATKAIMYKLEKQFPVNPRISQLLSHLISAKQVWLDRCMNLPQSVALWAERLPDEMRYDMENYGLAWLDFIDQLSDNDFDKTVTYTNSKGDTFTNKLTDIMAHVINHGTHHRGNLIVLMKEEGYVLPSLDLIMYLRK